MSQKQLNKKRVSFADQIEVSNINTNGKIINEIKKSTILKGKMKNNKELKNEKVLEVINEEKSKTKETKEENKLKEKDIVEPNFTNNNINHKMKQLSTEEYFKITVQTELEKGLLNIAMIHPANPIKFLGNYLIEKSKNYTPNS